MRLRNVDISIECDFGNSKSFEKGKGSLETIKIIYSMLIQHRLTNDTSKRDTLDLK